MNKEICKNRLDLIKRILNQIWNDTNDELFLTDVSLSPDADFYIPYEAFEEVFKKYNLKYKDIDIEFIDDYYIAVKDFVLGVFYDKITDYVKQTEAKIEQKFSTN